MERLFSPVHQGTRSRLSKAVAGIAREADIRDLLLGTGIQAFRKNAGYIPGEMSLGNEPKRMLKDWRSSPFRTRFSEYHYRWITDNFGDLLPVNEDAFWWLYIPWSQAHTYQACCHLSANACGLSRRNKLTFD